METYKPLPIEKILKIIAEGRPKAIGHMTLQYMTGYDQPRLLKILYTLQKDYKQHVGVEMRKTRGIWKTSWQVEWTGTEEDAQLALEYRLKASLVLPA